MKRIAVYVLAIVCILSLTGCGGAYKSELGSDVPPSADQNKTNAETSVANQTIALGSKVGDPAETGLKRKVTRDVSMFITVHNIKEIDIRIQQMLKEAGGYIQSSGIWQEKGRVQGRMTLRVPDEKLDGFISGLEALGKVERKNISGNDVTEEYYDVTARKNTLEKQEKRLLDLLNKAGSVKELLEIENELARIRGGIESLQARLKVLDNMTDYATVNIELKDPVTISMGEAVENPFGNRIKAAWLTGVNGAVSLLEGFVILLVLLLPFIPVFLLAGYVTYRIWKKRKT
ncbi:MAG: DUF4349 domain-containing protein [Desulfocucumaceae bacterium]